ncbi:MAG: RNA polymerase sigma factor [Hyphomicrobiales bacterium]
MISQINQSNPRKQGSVISNDIIQKLYDEVFPIVVSYIQLNQGSKFDAEDVFQEALCVLIKKAVSNQVVIGKYINWYIYFTCKNLWKKQLRDLKKDLIDFNEEFFIKPEIENILEIKNNEEIAYNKLEKAIYQLDTDSQRIIKLVLLDFDYKSIAELLGYKNAGYLRIKKHRIKVKLKKILKLKP